MRERSHEKLGEIPTDQPIEETTKAVYDKIRAHVRTTLDEADVVKGEVRVVDQALRSATTKCLETWTPKKREGRDGHIITIVLMQITRKQPGEVMMLELRSVGPSW